MATHHITAAKHNLTPTTTTSLFHHILHQSNNNRMPDTDLSIERLSKEAQVLLGAGTATTARTLDFISYHILASARVRAALQTDLHDLMAAYPARVPTWAELERCKYLQAVIKEGLR